MNRQARLDNARSAAQSVRVELPGAFSPEHDQDVAAYVAGAISAADAGDQRIQHRPGCAQ